MVETGAGANNIFRQVDQIQISDVHHQEYGYFGLIGIVNVVNKVLPNSLVVSDIQNLSGSAQDVQKLYYRLRSDMIDKSI